MCHSAQTDLESTEDPSLLFSGRAGTQLRAAAIKNLCRGGSEGVDPPLHRSLTAAKKEIVSRLSVLQV